MMDHALYSYSALSGRSAHTGGGHGEKVGLTAFAVLFLEHWEFDAPEGTVRDPRFVGEFGSFHPDYRNWSQREYGLRIGIFRVIDALKQAGIRPAIAANAMAVQRLPHLVELFNAWGCEWLGHGIAATRMMHSGQTVLEQGEQIRQSIEILTRTTGKRPSGWLSQDWGTTPDTYNLLIEAGIKYTLDWCNDDQPFWMNSDPRLLAIPLSAEWDDVQCQWLRQMEPSAHKLLTATAFQRLADECSQHQRAATFGLSIHPWVSGMPSRISALRQLLASIRLRPDVHWTNPGAIFDHLSRS
jgi:peptidoglycan/xylan/chitin deacetylase (PgdA/CDA1 family)